MIWSCLRANLKKRARTRRHTRPPGRVHPALYSTPKSSNFGAILPTYSTPWSSILSSGHSMTPLDPLVEYLFATPPDHTLPFTQPHHSTPQSSIITNHQHHHSTKHSITSSQSTQIRTQPDKLSTRKRRGEEEVFGSGLELHRITKPISAYYHSMGWAIRLLGDQVIGRLRVLS